MPIEITVPIGSGATVGSGVTTYSGLLGTLGAWLNRSDLDDRIPDFVDLLEARLNRILRTPEMEETVTLSTTAEEIDLPTDFREARSLYLDTDPRQEVFPVSLGTLRSKYALQITGKPEVYAISGGSIVFGPAPDAEYDAILTYWQDIEALSDANQTNWLISKHPDVYLYGALVMGEAFLWNDERLPLWKSAWDEALGELIGQSNRKRMSGPLRLRASVSE